MRPFAIAVLAVATAPASAVGAAEAPDREPLGIHGATIALPEGWARKEFSEDVGKDQFLHTTRRLLGRTETARGFILEFERKLETDADAERVFEEIRTGGLEDLRPGLLSSSDESGVFRATRELLGRVSGADLAYRFEAVSKDGLSFIAIGWATRSGRDPLRAAMASLVRGIEFPPPGSEWARLSDSVTERFLHGDVEVSFRLVPAVFRPDADSGRLASFTSRDGRFGIYIMDTTLRSPGAILDSVLRTLEEDAEEIREVTRVDVTLNDLPTLRSTILLDGSTVAATALPLGDGSFLDVRFVSPGGPELRRSDRDLFHESLRVERLDRLAGLPEPVAPPAPPTLDPWFRRLLEASRMVGDTGLRQIRRVRVDEGRVLVSDGTTEASLDLASGASPAGAPRTAPEDHLEPCGPGRRLVVRSEPGPSAPGLGAVSWVPPDRVVVVDPETGKEEELGAFEDPVEHAVANVAGSAVLVVAAWSGEPPRAVVLPAAGGERREVPGWASIWRVAAAGDGWLVSGRRRGGAGGIHLVDAEGRAEALVLDPDVTGAGIAGGELAYLSTLRLPGRDPDGSTLVAYAAPLEAVREIGPLCLPFSGGFLSRLGAEVLRERGGAWPFRTRDEVLATARLAVERSRASIARPLPTAGAELDRMAQEAYRSREDVTAEGELLLSVLLAAGLLEAGAEWVESGAPEVALLWQPRTESTGDTAVAVGYSPTEVIGSTLHDAKGHWFPTAEIERYRQGRKLLLGLDRGALFEALRREETPESRRAAALDDPAEILELLQGFPRNEFLRRRVYIGLAGRGRHDALLEVASAFAEVPEPRPVDVDARLLARTKLAKTAEEAAEVIEDLLRAVRERPTASALYLWLGAAHELRPDGRRLALACYQRVLSLEEEGELESLAQEGVRRVSEPPASKDGDDAPSAERED